MKGIVIYASKYGAAAQYAAWIGKELDIPVSDTGTVCSDHLSQFDFVVLGSSVYFGKLIIRNWLIKNAEFIQGKKLYLFVVSGTPIEQHDKLESYVSASVPGNINRKCEIFFLPGKMLLRQLSWFDRIMLRMGAKLTKDTKEGQRMLTEYNSVKRENISELISAVASSEVQI